MMITYSAAYLLPYVDQQKSDLGTYLAILNIYIMHFSSYLLISQSSWHNLGSYSVLLLA